MKATMKHAVPGTLLFALVAGAMPALAQKAALGTYDGVVQIDGVELEGLRRMTYKAEVRISMPLTGGDRRRLEAEINDVGTPSARARFSEFTVESREAAPDSDGRITSWSCKLAEAVEVPMNAQGTLEVDLAAKRYAMYVALAGLSSVPLQCVHSRSGPYRTTRGVALFFGTSGRETIPPAPLPLADAARISARHALPTGPAAGGSSYAAEQRWELTLRR
jgi:hypothetical protein